MKKPKWPENEIIEEGWIPDTITDFWIGFIFGAISIIIYGFVLLKIIN